MLNRNVISKIELCNKKSLLGYQENSSVFWKIYLYDYTTMHELRKLFERQRFDGVGFEQTVTYESRLDIIMRFIIDKDITGLSWITLPGKKYKVIDEMDRITTC